MSGFTKYQSVESTEVVTPEGHKAVEASLQAIGKTSAKELTDEERAKISKQAAS